HSHSLDLVGRIARWAYLAKCSLLQESGTTRPVTLELGKYLLVTNTMSCGLMMGAGDVLQQHSNFLKKRMPMTNDRLPNDEKGCLDYREDETEYDITNNGCDYVRTRNMTVVGFIQGPFNHYFYNILEKQLPGKSAGSILKKTLIDQTIASPICLGMFFMGLGMLEHKSLQEINSEIRLKLMNTWKVDCIFWPPTQFLNFLFVPIQYRVLYINFMTMIYDMFLSYIKYDACVYLSILLLFD
ncbi:PREDICTED: mpv17-like protein 2, partial [Ceratosolen solmsi marchali]|uniref:Mpv17-like protein 2 n=1 Tax=Ceratosolen solmsi marchali TaxID=326594 RepID=A0AAJ6YDL7_9HYME